MSIDFEWLGQVEYSQAWELQKALVAKRTAVPGQADKVLLLEHPPTYTLGRNGRLDNLLLSQIELAEQGIAFHHIDRGGDITYHGPGQLVGYPILNLRRLYAQSGLGLARKYVHDLEEMLIQLLLEFGLEGQRYENHRGVWIQSTPNWLKIAAIGVRVNKGYLTSHGFALNVAPNLQHFEGIVPCGLAKQSVTSMAALLGREMAMQDVVTKLTAVFLRIFYPSPT